MPVEMVSTRNSRIYVFSQRYLEDLYPEVKLKECGFSIESYYQQRSLFSNSNVMVINDDFSLDQVLLSNNNAIIIMPGYQDTDLHAPFYGGGNKNMIRNARHKHSDCMRGDHVFKIIELLKSSSSNSNLTFGVWSFSISNSISNSIPVLITRDWIPPFNEIVPFETYGIYHDEREMDTLVKHLRSIDEDTVIKLTRTAYKVCLEYFQTTDKMTQTVIKILMER
eukprot:314670_1